MKVYIVLSVSRVQPLIGCFSCAVDAAEEAKKYADAYVYDIQLNSTV